MDAIFKKIILTLEAWSAMTNFMGGVMGSHADFMIIRLTPEEFTYPSYSADPNMGMTPSQL